jgi:acetolactate synthase-1/2/3 large subunit
MPGIVWARGSIGWSVLDMTTGSEWLARAIASTGTTQVFFVEAVLRRTLIALEELGVQRVLAHSEKAAAYMADGYARTAGRPAFCFAQSVGAANLAAGLQDAYLGRSPVVALTGRKQTVLQHRNAYQEIAHLPLYAPVTKFNAEVDTAADLPRLLRQAIRAATSATPRPVHLDLFGVQGEVVETGTVDDAAEIGRNAMRIPPSRPVPSDVEIERAAAALRGAARVAIVAGEGALVSGAGAEVLALAEALAAPVATSLGARALVPMRHALCVGVPGFYSAPPANRIVHRADLVLFVGCDTGDQVTNTWRTPAPATPIVQIDIDPEELGRSYTNTLGLAGDPKATLAKLIEAVGTPVRDRSYAEWAAALLGEWRAGMAPHMASEASPIRVERLCAEITAALPDDAILLADTGYSGIWTGTCIDFNGNGQSYQRAAGSLGWSYPASLGAKLAAPKRKVVCFSGDGAFYYHLAELETARRCGIATVTVINNNSGFGQCVPEILSLQGNKPGHPEQIMRFGPTDFVAVARSFGVQGIRVEQPGQIGPALRRALQMDEPVVVDVVTDITSPAPVPWEPKRD